MGSDKDSQNLIMASLDFLSNKWNKERASLELSIARDEREAGGGGAGGSQSCKKNKPE